MRLLLLPGDGIGPEVIDEASRVIDWLNKNEVCVCEVEYALIGGAAIDACGHPLPDETLKLARDSNAVLMGSVGGPKWDQMSVRPEQGLLELRSKLGVYTNLRPCLSFEELSHASGMKPELIYNLDIMVVRELTGGIYFGNPRYQSGDSPDRVAVNTMIYHEYEIARIARRAFDIASARSGRLCSVDKANVLEVSQLWRDMVNEIGKSEYPNVQVEHLYVDNAVMQLVSEPKQFDVILSGNLFGDILSDAAAMLTGSIGMLPSACLSDSGVDLYEPVHGSAPDIAGTNSANPLATILSLAMLFRHSAKNEQVAKMIENAVRGALKVGNRTRDIQVKAETVVSTRQMGDAVIAQLAIQQK